MIALTMVALAEFTGYEPIPRPKWPDYVVIAHDAVAKRDRIQIETNFRVIEEIPVDGGHVAISAQDALQMLSNCAPADVHQIYDATYSISYVCPDRRKIAANCDSGDLGLMVDNESIFVVTHRRIYRPRGNPRCVPFAPPVVPKPLERGI